MAAIWNSALGLLLVTGLLLGLTLPFGRLATDAGVPPVVWSLVISAGAGLSLLAVRVATAGRIRLDAHRLRYFFVAAFISYVIPNLLMFSVIPHLGAGYTGVMFTLSPVVTLLLSVLFRIRRPGLLGALGIAVGFGGALLVAMTRGEAGRPADLVWVGMGLLIPVGLASGNVYRSFDWPDGVAPTELAAGSHLAAAIMLVMVLAATARTGDVAALAGLPWLVAAQVAASAAMFGVFFRLQAVGGPVYLSQIGYVAAAVGLISGTLFLGERYGPLTWIGALVIVAGVAMTTRAQAA